MPTLRVSIHRIIPVFCAAVLLGSVGCAPAERSHGHVWRGISPDELVIGGDTRQSVLRKAGGPSVVGLAEGAPWIYISQRVRKRSARTAVVENRQVVVVHFSDAGTVSAVEQYALADGRVIALSDRETPLGESDLTIFEQLLGNIGRFEE